jgi:hypothetical protein
VSPQLSSHSGTPIRPSGTGMVTIGIPTFNRAGSVGRTIVSALEQDHEPLEVLVVDNCSTDGTVELVAKLAAADPRVRLVRQPRNLGASVNFETALLEARGEFFMWLADDDWISPGYLRRCVEKLVTESHVVVVGRDFWHQPQGPVQERDVVVVDRVAHTRILNYLRRVTSGAAFYGVARTADLRRLLPLPRYIGGDWWWMLDLACRGTISVCEDAELHRSIGGMSWDPQAVVEHFGLGWFPRHLPQAAIALGVTRHLACSDHLTSIGGFPRRLAIAMRGGMIVCLRNGVIAELLTPVRRLVQRLIPPDVYARLGLAYRPVRRCQVRLRTLAIAPPREAIALLRSWMKASLLDPSRYRMAPGIEPCPSFSR